MRERGFCVEAVLYTEAQNVYIYMRENKGERAYCMLGIDAYLQVPLTSAAGATDHFIYIV